jgi:hypothetical protein
MALIAVPRPSKRASDPDRAANALLLAQIQHLHEAERNLPLRYRTDIYIHAIKTEREASEYIREVTEAIHQAHEDAATRRNKLARKPKRGLTIAAAAAPNSRKRARSQAKKKPKNSKRKK